MLAAVVAAAATALTAPPSGAPLLAGAAGPPRGESVGLRVLRLVDSSRRIRLPDGSSEPRPLLTYVRYPAPGIWAGDRLGAAPDRRGGPFPLIVFGHGFATTPAPYAALMRAWVRAGYVVAAPLFPLENANAPGGPNESDLVNQPRDMRFVIASLVAADAAPGPLQGLIEPGTVALAGHSDGGETALVAAYYTRPLDPAIRAAVILSGAQMPSGAGAPGAGTPPLLATQGTADTVNPPSITDAFFRVAAAPKYLLALLGAAHLPPYTVEQPQLGIVERVTLAFLDHYLKGAPLAPLLRAGSVPGLATLQADP